MAGERPTSPEQENEDEPRIYVASLADYNNGRLHGRWLDATQEPADLEVHVADVLAASPLPWAEEWAIHDYTGFAGLHIDEHEDLKRVSAIARGIVEHGPAYAAWVAIRNGASENPKDFKDLYLGHWASPAAYAEQFLEDFGALDTLQRHVPAWLRPYVQLDYASFGHNMEVNGDFAFAADATGVHVFDGHG
jgi:antirestriction protein